MLKRNLYDSHTVRPIEIMVLLFLTVLGPVQSLHAQQIDVLPVEKPRVIVLTDITNEPDDQESLVRFLVYASEYDVEGLIATTSTHLRNQVRPDKILELVAAYGQVRENLLLHEPGYPTESHLRERVKSHLPVYGMEGVGEGKSSEGSRLIIDAVDRDDDRPVWVTVWGGASCLAQALYDVRATRSEEELNRFVSKLRVYTISDQDDSGRWLRLEFPGLFFVVSPSSEDWREYYEATWTGISGDRFYRNGPGQDLELVDNPWLEENVINGHGPLGALYPRLEYIMEGDTPSFLGLIDNGLGSALSPAYGGWGGRYSLYRSYAETRPIWTHNLDARDVVTTRDGRTHVSNQATIWRWRRDYQHDFAARMDWCVKPFGEANHNPEVVVNNVEGTGVLSVAASPGGTLTLSATGSSDPDGDALTYRWWVYREAGTYPGDVTIHASDSPEARIEIPADLDDRTIHVILEVADDGEPALTSYRRVILGAETGETGARTKPRVLVTTDINIDSGDPDDRQSMAHLFWYADKLDLVGLIADRLNAGGAEATLAAIDAYEEDYENSTTHFRAMGYPDPDQLRKLLPQDDAAARALLIREARRATPGDPLYVLAWGNLHTLNGALREDPSITPNIRLVSIGTYLKSPADPSSEGCHDRNWNGGGRQEIFDDPRFKDLWWVEIDWTYAGMFEGPEPGIILDSLKTYGALGRHLFEVVQPHTWAHYFRVGDTPSVLYVIDPDNPLDDPTHGSWAGRFVRPFPDTRPRFYTGIDGGVEWDYADPCRTWESAAAVNQARIGTLLEHRQEMYDALLDKVRRLYR